MDGVRRYSLAYRERILMTGRDSWWQLYRRACHGETEVLQKFPCEQVDDEETCLTQAHAFLRERGERIIGITMIDSYYTIFTEPLAKTQNPVKRSRQNESLVDHHMTP